MRFPSNIQKNWGEPWGYMNIHIGRVTSIILSNVLHYIGMPTQIFVTNSCFRYLVGLGMLWRHTRNVIILFVPSQCPISRSLLFILCDSLRHDVMPGLVDFSFLTKHLLALQFSNSNSSRPA